MSLRTAGSAESVVSSSRSGYGCCDPEREGLSGWTYLRHGPRHQMGRPPCSRQAASADFACRAKKLQSPFAKNQGVIRKTSSTLEEAHVSTARSFMPF